MKFTLLEIVQDILNDIDGDEVDSITDTSEATQVANIVRSTYWHLISQKDLPHHKSYFKLLETDSTTPTLMTIPDDVIKVYWIRYDQKAEPGAFSGGVFSGDAFDTTESSFFPNSVTRLHHDDFFNRMGRLTWTGSDIEAFTYTSDTGDSFEVKYQTNQSPMWYTVFGETDVLFNSIDTDIDGNFLQADNTWCFGLKKPSFLLSDSFTPDMESLEFNWLMEEAKSACSIKLRQVNDPVASLRAKRGWVRSQRNLEKKVPFSSYESVAPNFGRRTR